MILIAESGASKTDWSYILEDKTIHFFSSAGMHPGTTSSQQLKKILNQEVIPKLSKTPAKVYFYGAGCRGEQNQKKIKALFNELLPETKIIIDTDLMAAGIAAFKNSSGLICILGTGSNTGFYTPNKILQKSLSLGYILGDEGSGAHMGKLLMETYLRNKLPEELDKKLHQSIGLDKDQVLNKIYNREQSNVFLASFTPFIRKYQEHAAIAGIIHDSFDQFIEKQLNNYTSREKSTIKASGSIAYYFRNILEDRLKSHKLMLSEVIKKPIEQLSEYHRLENINF